MNNMTTFQNLYYVISFTELLLYTIYSLIIGSFMNFNKNNAV